MYYASLFPVLNFFLSHTHRECWSQASKKKAVPLEFRNFLLYYGDTYFKHCGWYTPADWKQKLQNVFGSKAGQGKDEAARTIAAEMKAELDKARKEKGK